LRNLIKIDRIALRSIFFIYKRASLLGAIEVISFFVVAAFPSYVRWSGSQTGFR